MVIGILKEIHPETRVSLVPENIKLLKELDLEILVESKAGQQSNIPDSLYEEAGAEVAGRDQILDSANIFVVVNHPGLEALESLGENKIIAGCLNPFINFDVVDKLMDKYITSFSLELLPRTTIAQSMDVLSSMAMIAGYKAVLEAAMLLPKFFPMFMTSAGTLKPAKMLILGAGVAGLQAIATARRLGAIVEVFDVRSAVREEVISLGGRFIEVEGAKEDISAGGYAVEQTEDFKKKQAELIHRHVLKSDVVICTAQIPGRRAPLLLRKETVDQMTAGSVIIDLAASTGGNCELTKNNETVHFKGVRIVGQSAYPSLMPADASKMYSNNLTSFLKLIVCGGDRLVLNWDDEIICKTCLTHKGKLISRKIDKLYNDRKKMKAE